MNYTREKSTVSSGSERQIIEPIVKVQEVHRVYRVGQSEVAALRGVSFSIERGELVILRGISGSGKTTLLNLIGGLDKATSGELVVCGNQLSKMSNRQINDLRRQKLGFVFQSFALIPTFSAVENVELMLRIAGVRREKQRRAMQSLQLVGLAPWAGHRPWEMSGGQQQRVSIARALVTRPELILADEPTGELDSSTGRQIMSLFRHIATEQGITVLMATHDPTAAEFAHKVLDLVDGQISTH